MVISVVLGVPVTHLRPVFLVSYSARASKAVPKQQRLTSQKLEFCAVGRCGPGGWRRIPAESGSKRECFCRHGAPTPGCRSFRGLPGRRATRSETGACLVHRRRCDTAGISISDGATLLRRRRAEIEGPLFWTW